jgi:CxxH/CxxC protein (TIGR04129 family)
MGKLKMDKVEGGIYMIYCCDEHINIALDQIVDEYEVAPDFKKITNGLELSTPCEYCGNEATYLVTN